jgi:hypothetical protein
MSWTEPLRSSRRLAPTKDLASSLEMLVIALDPLLLRLSGEGICQNCPLGLRPQNLMKIIEHCAQWIRSGEVGETIEKSRL